MIKRAFWWWVFVSVAFCELRDTNTLLASHNSFSVRRVFVVQYYLIDSTTSWPPNTYTRREEKCEISRDVRTHARMHAHPSSRNDEKPEIRLAMSISSLIKHARLAYNSNTILQLLLLRETATTLNWFHIVSLGVCCARFFLFIICLRGPNAFNEIWENNVKTEKKHGKSIK